MVQWYNGPGIIGFFVARGVGDFIFYWKDLRYCTQCGMILLIL